MRCEEGGGGERRGVRVGCDGVRCEGGGVR